MYFKIGHAVESVKFELFLCINNYNDVNGTLKKLGRLTVILIYNSPKPQPAGQHSYESIWAWSWDHGTSRSAAAGIGIPMPSRAS